MELEEHFEPERPWDDGADLGDVEMGAEEHPPVWVDAYEI